MSRAKDEQLEKARLRHRHALSQLKLEEVRNWFLISFFFKAYSGFSIRASRGKQHWLLQINLLPTLIEKLYKF